MASLRLFIEYATETVLDAVVLYCMLTRGSKINWSLRLNHMMFIPATAERRLLKAILWLV